MSAGSGRQGIPEGETSCEIILGPELELVAADPPFLALVGWTSNPPPTADLLLGTAPESIREHFEIALGAGLPERAGPFDITTCWTSLGLGRRIRAEMEGARGAAASVWSRDISHQLRNQQMVLAHALHGLEENGGGTSSLETQLQSLQLGQLSLKCSFDCLEALEALAFHPHRDARTDPAQFLSWVETLIEPRIRRQQARLIVERDGVGPTELELDRSSRIVAALLGALVPRLREGQVLTLAAREDTDGVRLEARIEGLTPEVRQVLHGEISPLSGRTGPLSAGSGAEGWWVRLPSAPISQRPRREE